MDRITLLKEINSKIQVESAPEIEEVKETVEMTPEMKTAHNDFIISNFWDAERQDMN
jgi:hypothetical protein